jgi:signal transduction histidine kinase
MSPKYRDSALDVLKEWKESIRHFKEMLAKRLWSLPSVSETEKEMVYRQYLTDLDQTEKLLSTLHDDLIKKTEMAKDENELLRSLLGVPDDELRLRNVSLGNELNTAKKEGSDLHEELQAARDELHDISEENELYRKKTRQLEADKEKEKFDQAKLRQEDIEFFAKEHSDLGDKVKDLETRLGYLRELFDKTNADLVRSKQDEITALQKSLVKDMEETLYRRQKLVWREEELFAKGIAHRIRNALVSVQGQLLLTLERMGVLEPESKSEKFWKARWHLFVEGASELSQNFHILQRQLQEITRSLDDYMNLTYQHTLKRAPLDIVALVKSEMGPLYVDRKPTLSVEFHADEDLPLVFGDKSVLQFVVETVLTNALEALPNESGRIGIYLKNRQDRGMVQLVVEDSGQGIPVHLKSRLFEPFFTTKEGRNGLSLSRAHRFVELHGGQMGLVKSSEEGTVIKLELPIKEKQ